MPAKSRVKTAAVLGQETFLIKNRNVQAGITSLGGHLWPAKFRIGKKWIAPLSAFPLGQTAGQPNILKVLRGDFFCMPFGGNKTDHGGERHPLHGETANRKWKSAPASGQTSLHFFLRTVARRGRVDKFLALIDGHPAIYQRHIVSGMAGSMPAGYHAMLRLPSQGSARISTSPFVHGQVFPGEFENPARGGYSCLKPGAVFSSLKRVPRADGRFADLSIYPDREGFDDLVMLVSDCSSPFAWTAAVVPEEGWVWFSLKNPNILRSSIFWMSNGGLHSPPWRGRHRRVIGIEDVTSYFHCGLAESVKSNPLSRSGIPTCFAFTPDQPVSINSIMAMSAIPKDFDEVRRIRAGRGGRSVKLAARSGATIEVPLNVDFLFG